MPLVMLVNQFYRKAKVVSSTSMYNFKAKYPNIPPLMWKAPQATLQLEDNTHKEETEKIKLLGSRPIALKLKNIDNISFNTYLFVI